MELEETTAYDAFTAELACESFDIWHDDPHLRLLRRRAKKVLRAIAALTPQDDARDDAHKGLTMDEMTQVDAYVICALAAAEKVRESR